MANSVDPVCSGSTLFASILNSSVMLGNYMQQTTSADDIFRCIFFLGALRVKLVELYSCKRTLYLNSAVIVCWLQLTSAQNSVPSCLTSENILR